MNIELPLETAIMLRCHQWGLIAVSVQSNLMWFLIKMRDVTLLCVLIQGKHTEGIRFV